MPGTATGRPRPRGKSSGGSRPGENSRAASPLGGNRHTITHCILQLLLQSVRPAPHPFRKFPPIPAKKSNRPFSQIFPETARLSAWLYKVPGFSGLWSSVRYIHIKFSIIFLYNKLYTLSTSFSTPLFPRHPRLFPAISQILADAEAYVFHSPDRCDCFT